MRLRVGVRVGHMYRNGICIYNAQFPFVKVQFIRLKIDLFIDAELRLVRTNVEYRLYHSNPKFHNLRQLWQ